MNTYAHRPGVDERYLVKRHLQLEHLEPEAAEPIVQDIDALIGVDRVSVDTEASSVDIAYDASTSDHMLTDIENVLYRHGCDMSGNWWARFKRNWYEFSDRNIHDNAELQPHCCSKAPPGK